MSRVADASFVIALLDEEDPRRADALDLVRQPEPSLVPPEVVRETLSVIHARRGYCVAEAVWHDPGELPNIVFLSTTRVEDIAPIFLGAEGAISWTDAAVVAHGRREDAAPLCYDDGIKRALARPPES